MERDDLLRRITSNPEIFSGKPIIRGMRISVDMNAVLGREQVVAVAGMDVVWDHADGVLASHHPQQLGAVDHDHRHGVCVQRRRHPCGLDTTGGAEAGAVA